MIIHQNNFLINHKLNVSRPESITSPAMKYPLLLLLSCSLIFPLCMNSQSNSSDAPLKIGVAGLSHSHVHWILGRPDRGDIEIVGIAEPNRALAQRFADQHGYSMDIVYPTLEEMIEATQPEAVTAFGSIYDHLAVVQTCAPKGIHVMVEKPLAVSLEHAKQMYQLAQEHQIHLLTNYETTWYATHHHMYEMVEAGNIGPLRKVVVHDGHPGPMEIGVNQEFLDWLTDPEQNGAGALTDFGCYGANLITWLNNNEVPVSVTALAQTLKPDIYPKVDDEATILVEYPHMQGIIQASWNWPISRKDMEVYGKTGVIYCDNRSDMRYQLGEDKEMEMLNLEERKAPLDDPFALMEAVVRGRITLEPHDLSALENNMVVMQILQAAMESVATGKKVMLGQ